MRAEQLPIHGAVLLHGSVYSDDRGSFRRVFDGGAMADLDLEDHVAQVSVATNVESGTVRGLHYQAEPHTEAKTLWCSRGSVFDVLVDLRAEQSTYGHSWSTTLVGIDPVALHVPRGVAHGYQTLDDNTELIYIMSTIYHASSARVLQAFDPQLAIEWPLPVTRMSRRDREAPKWPPSF